MVKKGGISVQEKITKRPNKKSYTELNSMVSVELLLGHLGDLRLEDDLNIVLQWLSPQEHQCHPPSLRVKTSIKTVIQHANEPFNDGLCLYYYDIVRKECLSLAENNSTTFTYSQLTKLENKLYYPLEFIPILKGTTEDHSLATVIFSIRHYILNTNKSFTYKLKERIQRLIEEEEFHICQKLIQWIEESGSTEFNAKGLVLDILLEKIEDKCKLEMVKLWGDRAVVDYTYMMFMKDCWPGFQQLLDIPDVEEEHKRENDRDTTIPELIHDHFEKQFINRRMSEILLIVMNCAKAGPTLLELRPLIKKYNLVNKLVAAFLIQFQKLIVESPKTTSEILQIFIMGIDVFIYLDIRDHYLRVLTTFMKPFLASRENFVSSYLYAALGLKSKEFEDFNIEKPEGVTKLRHALKGKHLSYFTSHSVVVPLGLKQENTYLSGEKNEMIIYDVLRQYKTWVPDELTMDPGERIATFQQEADIHPESHVLKKGRSNLLADCVLSLIDDKEHLVTLLLDVITRRLLRYPSRNLESKYLIVYLRLYQRIRNGHNLLLPTNDNSKNESDHKLEGNSAAVNTDDIDSELIVDDGITKRYNDRIAYIAAIDEEDEIFVKFNKINVMLGDMRESDLMDRFIRVPKPKRRDSFARLEESIKIYPKFVSSFYWNINKKSSKENENDKKDAIKISDKLEEKILEYTKGYRKLKPGRVLRYCNEETVLSVTITDSNTNVETLHNVTMKQYRIIEKFDSNVCSLALEALADQCSMSAEEIKKNAKYWVDNKILRFDGRNYYAFDRTLT